MSKTELLYNKILKITMFVAVISLILLIVDLFFAVTKQAIDCSGQFCTIDSSETFFRLTIWLLLVFVVIFVVIARIMLFLLTRENKLEDAASYKSRTQEQSDSSDFSESQLYEDIKSKKITGKPIKVKKAKKVKTGPTIGEVFAGAINSIKEFFRSLKDKRNIKKAEKVVQKAGKAAEKATEKETKAAEKEAARIEREEKLKVEREAERLRLEALAIEEAKRNEEKAIQDAKDKESREKEALLLAKLRENEELENRKAKEESVVVIPEEKEYFTRLNKTELIALVAEASDLSKAKCKLVVNTFMDTIVEELGKGNDVNIGKFGKFKKVTIKESKIVNPKTGKTIITPEENDVNFLPDKLFKEMITDDIESTSDKNLFTKKVMKDMTEDEVQEQLIKEEKSKEHLESKILGDESIEKPLSKKEIKAQLKKEKKEEAARVKAEKALEIARIKEEKALEAARIKEEKALEAKRLEEKRLEDIAIQEAKDEELRVKAAEEKAKQDAINEELRIKEEKEKAKQDAIDEKQRIKEEKAQAKQDAKDQALREKAMKEAEEKELKEKAIQEAKEKEEKELALKEAKALQDAKEKELKAKVVVASKPAKPKEVKKTKADVIEYIEIQTGISKNKSNKFLKFFAEVVKEELAKGKDVVIPGFGMFTTIEMPAKEAVNPQTNKKIIVPAHHQARLRFDDKFKKKFEVK